MRRYSKVGKNTVNAILIALMENMVVYPSEVAPDECQTRIVDAVSDCIHVSVKGEHAAIK